MNPKRRPSFSPLTASGVNVTSLAAVFGIPLLVLAERLAHRGTLNVTSYELSGMRLITGICLVLAAFALACLRGREPRRTKRIAARSAGIVVGIVGLLTVASYHAGAVSGSGLPGVHRPFLFFMADPFRMSIITAVLFSVFGGVIFLLSTGRRAANVAHGVLLPVALMTYLVITGYLFKIHTLYEWLSPGIAPSTAIAFVALCLAALSLRPDGFVAEVFNGEEAGAIMARRLVPAVVLLPLAIGWLRIEGERRGLYRSEVGVAIVAFTYTVLFSTLVWFSARSVNRTDRGRRRAEEETRKSAAAVRFKLETLLSPEGDIGDLDLADIIDVAGIRELMENFNRLAPIPMGIIDLRGGVLVGTGWQEICTRFHRANGDSCRNCIESDTVLSQEIPAGEFKLYKCKNNLWDMATPIMVGGRKIGNLFLGQFFFEEEAIDYDLFHRQARRYGFDEREYLAALDRVPRLSRRTIDHGKAFFVRLAEMLSQASFSNIKLAREVAQGEVLAKSLRESQALLQAVLETAPDPVFVKDRESRLMLANPATLAAFGKGREQVIGKTDAELYDDAAMGLAIMANDRKVMASGRTQVVEELVPYPGGDRIFLSSKTPLRDASGAAIGIVGIARDITERKKTEEALLRSEARLQLFVENAPAAIAMLDREMRYINASRRWFTDYGLESVDIIGKSHYEIFPDIPDRWREIHRRCLAGAVESCNEDPFLRTDGRTDWIDWEIRPWFGDREEIGGIVIFSQNVTERRQLTEALRRSEERFRLALKNAPVAIAAQDRDLQFLWAYNPQSVRPEEIIGKTDADIFAPRDAAIVAALKRKVLASGVELREQLWLESDGKRMFLDLFIEPMRDASGMIDGVGVATVDFTQLKKTEEALQRMVKRFELLTDTAAELLSARDPQKIIESLCRRVMEHLDCQVFFNYLVDADAGKLRLNACAGIPEKEAERIGWLDYGSAVCGCVARDGCRIVAERIPTTPDPRTDLVKSYGVRAYACHPLLAEGGAVIGTLSFGTRDREIFSSDDLFLMKAVADRVATAMTKMRMADERESLLDENRRRKDFLNAVIDNTPYRFSVTLGAGHYYAFVNKTLRGHLTFAGIPGEVVGRSVAEVWAGTPGLDATIGHLDRAFSTGKIVRSVDEPQPYSMSGHLSGADTETYFTTLYVPFKNDSGEVYGVLTISIETTEQVLARKKNEESEARFRRLMENVPVPLCQVNPSGALVYSNARFRTTFGYAGAEVPTLDAWWRLACPDESYREWARGAWEEAVVGARTRGADVLPIEYTLTGGDGEERRIELSGITLDDNVLATFFDVTERKKREQELRRYNRMLKALGKSSQAMMRAKNESEYLREVCRIVVEDCGHAMVWVGFAEDDEAKTVRPVASAGFEDGYLATLNISWDDTERGRGPTGTAIRTGKIAVCRNMAVDPAFLPWRSQAVRRGYASSLVLPLMADSRAFGALTIYSRDVDPFSDDEVGLLTELAADLASGIMTLRSAAARSRAEDALGRTAEELSRSNKDLEMFAYAASHDLQEPLRAVAGFMGILKDKYNDRLDSDARDYIGYAVEGAERMQRLIHDLLTYSRVGTRGGRKRPSPAAEALDAALYNLRLAIQESGAVVTRGSLPVITADGAQLIQVFQNLIGNAIKFRGDRRPEIDVGARHENGGWVFAVADNGIGIEEQYFDRIFVIFQRLHSREQYDGTGIGLAVVKKIIERHDGAIWVESTFGKGSTFYFSIPDRGELNDDTACTTDSDSFG